MTHVVEVSCPKMYNDEFGQNCKRYAQAQRTWQQAQDRQGGQRQSDKLYLQKFSKHHECSLDVEQQTNDLVGEDVWLVYICMNRCLILRRNADDSFRRIGLYGPQSIGAFLGSLYGDDVSHHRHIAEKLPRRDFVIV